jgi:hypothetical protein
MITFLQSDTRRLPSITPIVTRRLIGCVSVGLAAGAVAGLSHTTIPSDFSLVVNAARAWMAGSDPYAVTHGPFAQLYPFTAVLFAVPFALLPSPDFWFVGFGVGLFVWAITGSQRFPFAWLVLLSPGMFQLVFVSQWSALLTGAALIPAAGFLLACKPTIGAALFVAFPTRTAFLSVLLFGVLSLAVYPEWPWRWREVLQDTGHMVAPVMLWGGPIVLIALTRWRQWDARLLVALACVPQTHFYYDAWPLWLIPRTLEQAAFLTASSWAMSFVQIALTGPDGDASAMAYAAERATVGQLSVVFVYLPCLWFVMRNGARR